MAHKFAELEKKMKPASLARSRIRAKELMTDMLLNEIRKEAGLTQADLAKALKIKQPSLSKLETQDDMQISTLRRIIHALSGEAGAGCPSAAGRYPDQSVSRIDHFISALENHYAESSKKFTV